MPGSTLETREQFSRVGHQAIGKHLYMLSHFAGLGNKFSIGYVYRKYCILLL